MNFEEFLSDDLRAQLVEIGVTGMLNVAMAAAILIAGYLISGVISRAVRRSTEKHPNIDRTLAIFFASTVRYAILVVVFIAVLNRFGVQTTSLVAALGAAAFAVGLALQGTLSNVAAGVMIVFFRPYKLDDFVDIAGVMGTVRDINLFTTILTTPDNKRVIIPNGQSWGKVITNFSSNPNRRVEWNLGISYDDDIEHAISVIRAQLEADERILADPPVFAEVMSYGDSSINIVARGWVKLENFWPVFFDHMRRFKKTFDDNGISIPFPHRVMVQPRPAPAKPAAKKPSSRRNRSGASKA
ncbi:MAG: mechanosensitive ion channel [Maricaulaceae bacterium]|nr:mechanosensitive ion channel [Maricaulaceae bacterium]